MKKYIAGLFLTILFYSGESLAGSTHDMPIPTECSYCVTDYQFKFHAKSKAPKGDINYYLVYNTTSKQVKTVRVIDIYEPWDGISFTGAFIVNTMQDHLVDFNNYMTFLESGKDEDVYEIDYSTLGGTSVEGFRAFESTYGGYDSLQGLTLAHLGTSKPFAAGQYEAITITFPNGDMVIIAINDGPKDSLLSISQLPILVVVDEDGNEIFVLTTNDSSVVEQEGSLGAGGYIIFQSHTFDGVLVCYGECPIRQGIVTVKPVKDDN